MKTRKNRLIRLTTGNRSRSVIYKPLCFGVLPITRFRRAAVLAFFMACLLGGLSPSSVQNVTAAPTTATVAGNDLLGYSGDGGRRPTPNSIHTPAGNGILPRQQKLLKEWAINIYIEREVA